MGTKEQIIPLCRAEFLQDFSIALCKCLKPIRYASKSIIAEVDTCEHEGQDLEKHILTQEEFNEKKEELLCF